MREHFERIYRDHAEAYDRLVEREDHDGNLLEAVRAVAPLNDAEIVEFGAGTGRVTRRLAPSAARVMAFDASEAMLEVARQRNSEHAGHVQFAVGPHDRIPLPDAIADIAIEGWSFGHLAEDPPPAEAALAVQQAIDEMERLVRPGGVLVLIETLGTGRTTPQPPAPYLERMYRYVEEQGFARSWCRTDYVFASEAEARHLIEFFFGAPMLEHLDLQTLRLPECTGLWHRARA